MPTSVINSDDGAISGTSGLKTSGGDDGLLNIQSNGTNIVELSSGVVAVKGNSTTAAAVRLYEDTDNGTNYAAVIAPAVLGSDITLTLPPQTATLGYRNIPPVGTQTGSYTLTTADVGEYVQVGSGGSITVPTSTFAEGDAISIFNNTTGNITITCSALTTYVAGVNTARTSLALATRGVCTILFISSTVCVISGNVS